MDAKTKGNIAFRRSFVILLILLVATVSGCISFVPDVDDQKRAEIEAIINRSIECSSAFFSIDSVLLNLRVDEGRLMIRNAGGADNISITSVKIESLSGNSSLPVEVRKLNVGQIRAVTFVPSSVGIARCQDFVKVSAESICGTADTFSARPSCVS